MVQILMTVPIVEIPITCGRNNVSNHVQKEPMPMILTKKTKSVRIVTTDVPSVKMILIENVLNVTILMSWLENLVYNVLNVKRMMVIIVIMIPTLVPLVTRNVRAVKEKPTTVLNVCHQESTIQNVYAQMDSMITPIPVLDVPITVPPVKKENLA